MINKEFLEALRADMPQLDWRTDAPMSRYTTLRVGGPSDCLAEPDSDDEPGALLRLAERGVTDLLLGVSTYTGAEGYRASLDFAREAMEKQARAS